MVRHWSTNGECITNALRYSQNHSCYKEKFGCRDFNQSLELIIWLDINSYLIWKVTFQ